MTHSLDDIHRRINAAADAGFCRHVGDPVGELGLAFFKDISFVKADAADRGLASQSFESLLLELRPMANCFPSDDKRRAFEGSSNSIVELTRPYISGISNGLDVTGLNNEPQGFSPSLPASTIEWILVSFAKEYVAKVEYGYFGPPRAEDLMICIELGRLPCGWASKPTGGVLAIY